MNENCGIIQSKEVWFIWKEFGICDFSNELIQETFDSLPNGGEKFLGTLSGLDCYLSRLISDDN